ncbi:mitochondrial carrier domain-containing protein [Chytridium lagenaria]|nr:mitochondrial carrier domain-containing protein [Chytridium lagenaria]
MSTSKQRAPPHIHLASGAVSGLISCVSVQPLDVRLQQQRADNPSWMVNGQVRILQQLRCKCQFVSNIVRDIVLKDSIFGLWRGAWPTALRTVPGSAMYFMFLDKTKHAFNQGRLQGYTFLTTTSVHLLSGAISRISVGLMMMPITVIKVRYESNLCTICWDYVMLYEGMKPMLSSELIGNISTKYFESRHLSPKQIALSNDHSTIEEGIHGFFIGVVPRIVRKSFSSAITWTVYERVELSRLLVNYNSGA